MSSFLDSYEVMCLVTLGTFFFLGFAMFQNKFMGLKINFCGNAVSRAAEKPLATNSNPFQVQSQLLGGKLTTQWQLGHWCRNQ